MLQDLSIYLSIYLSFFPALLPVPFSFFLSFPLLFFVLYTIRNDSFMKPNNIRKIAMLAFFCIISVPAIINFLNVRESH